jgi:hypothetical protein
MPSMLGKFPFSMYLNSFNTPKVDSNPGSPENIAKRRQARKDARRAQRRNYSTSNSTPSRPLCEEHFIKDPANSRDLIKDLTKGRVGAYVWTNLLNGNQYVGSSMGIMNRIFSYFMVSIVSKGSRYILRAFNKYGMINFTLHLYLLPEGADHASVLALEQYFIDTLEPKYNILKVAGSSVGNPFSEENKAKFREDRGEKVYMYNADSSQLLYVFLSKTQIVLLLHLHRSTLDKALALNGAIFTFIFSLSLLEDADNSQPLSLEEAIRVYQEAAIQGRALAYSKVVKRAQVIVQATNTIDPSKTFTLNSLRKMANHFQCDRTTVQSYLLSGKLFRNEWIFNKVN